MASHVGQAFRWSQNKGYALIMAINTAKRNGTRMTLAALMPATTTIKDAMVVRI